MALIPVLVLVAAAMLSPGLVVGPSLDAAVFNEVGGRLLHGVAPYLGAWDHKPPGIYLLAAAAQALLGWLGPWRADWLVSLAASAGIGLAVASVLVRLDVGGWPRSLSAIGTTLLASHYLLALGGGLTEPPAAALLGWALVLAVRPGTRMAPVGVLVGLSALLSVQLLPGGLAVLALGILRRPAGRRLWGAGIAALCFAAPLSATALWLLLIGAMPAAIDAILGYSAAYRSAGFEYGAILATSVAAWTTLVSLFLITPALLGVTPRSSFQGARRQVVIALLVWVGATLLFFLYQGRFYAHYAIVVAIPVGILAGLGLQRVGESLRRAGRRSSRAIVLVPLVATLLVSVVAGLVGGALQVALVADGNIRAEAVSKRIGDLPAGTMLVWGNQPGLYSLSGRLPATRYSYLYPLTTPSYSTSVQIGEVARMLAAEPPAIVVDAGSSAPGQPGFLPLLIDRPIATDGRDLDLLDPLRGFVAAHYRLVETVSGWPIYVLRQETSP